MRPHMRNCWFEGPGCALLNTCEESPQGIAGMWRKAGRWTSCFTMMIRHFAGNPWPVTATAQLVVQGQHCRDNAQRSVRTEATTVHGTARDRIPSHCVINGMVSESQGCGRVVCLSMRKLLEKVEEPVYFETPSRGTHGRSRRNSVINLGRRQGLVH